MTGLLCQHQGRHQRTRWADMIAAVRRSHAQWKRLHLIG